jgi:predicted ATP-dependent endonuclease of OLD family
VWTQLLTYIVQSKDASIFIIDEPDIYLHSDLQRQLVSILKSLGPDILIATHSTEIISETDPDDILIVNKKYNSAQRIKNPTQLQSIFGILGSNLNPTLTQLAKTKRAIFVEGKDFQILSLFARKLRKEQVATRADFATIPVEGFNALKVFQMSEGIEITLGSKIAKAVIFDRDYRTEDKVKETLKELNKVSSLAWIHSRKEIENYLLIPSAIERAIINQIDDRNKRTGDNIEYKENVLSIFESITDSLKTYTMSQIILKQKEYIHSLSPHLDDSTITENILRNFESLWISIEERIKIVSGKKVLSALNTYLQENYKITLTPNRIITLIKQKEIPEELQELIEKLDAFRKIETKCI